MKKLSILVALILCVTIGGVYAAWQYAGAASGSVDIEISHGMTTATQQGSVGTFSIESNSLRLAIDQKAVGDYTAVLNVTGEMRISFKPGVGVSTEIAENAVPTRIYFDLVGVDENKYNGTAIYTTTSEITVDWGAPDATGVFYATITAAQIDSIIDLGGDFILPTYAAYQSFHGLESQIDLNLYIAQKS